MGLRENMAKKPGLTAALAAGLVVVAGAIIFYQIRSNAPENRAASKDGYYTTDDGATTFVDGSGVLPPFEHDGKTAVRAVVVDVDGKPKVAYLERFTPERLKLAAAAADAAKNNQPYPKAPPEMQHNPRWGVEVKKPGDTQWVAASDFTKAQPIVAAANQGALVTP